jgi:hypothetical protein
MQLYAYTNCYLSEFAILNTFKKNHFKFFCKCVANLIGSSL